MKAIALRNVKSIKAEALNVISKLTPYAIHQANKLQHIGFRPAYLRNVSKCAYIPINTNYNILKFIIIIT
jgi:hypothetical protein